MKDDLDYIKEVRERYPNGITAEDVERSVSNIERTVRWLRENGSEEEVAEMELTLRVLCDHLRKCGLLP